MSISAYYNYLFDHVMRFGYRSQTPSETAAQKNFAAYVIKIFDEITSVFIRYLNYVICEIKSAFINFNPV